jgi:hypothetical protein
VKAHPSTQASELRERVALRMSKALITIGLMFIILGLLWPWLQKLPFGRLPGDIVIQRDNLRLFFPITSSIIISLVVSALIWWLRK